MGMLPVAAFSPAPSQPYGGAIRQQNEFSAASSSVPSVAAVTPNPFTAMNPLGLRYEPLSSSSFSTTVTPPQTVTLNNGAQATLQQAVGRNRSVVNVLLPTNPYNLKGNLFLGDVVLAGSEATKRFMDALASKGFSVGLSSAGKATVLSVSGPAGTEAALPQIALYLLQKPKVDAQSWNTIKTLGTQALVDSHNMPGTKLGESLLKTLVGPEHPYAVLSDDRVNLQAMLAATPSDINAELQRNLANPANVKISMVSPLPPDQQAALLNQANERRGWQAGPQVAAMQTPAIPDLPKLQPAGGVQGPILTAENALTRSSLIFSWRGPTPDAPDYEAFQMLLKLLGLAGGMSSGFFDVLRSQKGLVYSTHQDFDVQPKLAQYLVGADVDFANTKEALTGFQEVLNQAITQAPPSDALERIKRKTILELRSQNQTSEGIAESAVFRLGFDLKPRSENELLQRIEAVTPQDVLRAAQKYLDPHSGYMVYGIAAPEAVLNQLFPGQLQLKPYHLESPSLPMQAETAVASATTGHTNKPEPDNEAWLPEETMPWQPIAPKPAPLAYQVINTYLAQSKPLLSQNSAS